MKKILLLVSILFLVTNLFGQARIGFTKEQILEEFSEFNFISGVTDDGVKYIYTEYYLRGSLLYYFDSINICFLFIFYPKTTGVINFILENLKEEFVIVSEKN